MNTNRIAALTLVALVAVFAVQNAEIVEIRFLFWGVRMSRALMTIVLLAVGIAVGWLLRGFRQHDGRKRT
ncbi:MAG: lipopolysaccharide assembly protein LapA domain-containing protein [Gammaproteobacteria bacterium]